MISFNAILEIERLGARGEGISPGPVFTPYALAGETIRAEIDGDRGKLVEILTPSPDRIAAPCPHFTRCGGCAVQNLREPAYRDWKKSLVADALRNAGVAIETAPLVEAWGKGRRRVALHARYDQRGNPHVGFMEARSHKIFELTSCPILAPELLGAFAAAKTVAKIVKDKEKPLDIVVTASLHGLDLDLRGCGKLDFAHEQALIAAAQELDLARLSNHGLTLIERRAPEILVGTARVVPPPGGFLQATEQGERSLANLVRAAIGDVKKCADLFAGVGTFALRLAEKAEVLAVESDAAALEAGLRAARATPALRRIEGLARDLFARPMRAEELAGVEAVVFDPPRAGAEAQAAELARSDIPTVVGVSCNPQSFSRDAKLLIAGGYQLERVTPVDQFLFSPHVELVGVFRKTPTKQKRKRRLLG